MSEESDARTVTVGIVDNDAMVTQYLDALFAPRSVPVCVLWSVHGGRDALRLCAGVRMRPQVVLTDMAMPVMDGMELAGALHAAYPDLHIVAMAAFDITRTREELHAVGIDAAVRKDVTLEALVRVIGRAAGNRAVSGWDRGVVAGAHEPLTETETMVMRLYAQGRTTEAIAHQLHIGVSTVKVHLRSVYAKLGVSSRSEAVAVCVREGIIP